MTMTPHLFIAKWKRSNLSEMSAYQQHFLDLCDVLGEKKPADVDPDGTWYTFQKGVTTTEDAKGWADVWLRNRFGLEYKGKHKDLKAAYQQLLKYREALENPPLLIVCDLDRFEIHTNFTGTAKQVYELELDDLIDPKKLQLLRDAFKNPEALKPGKTQKQVTEEVAETFAKIADGMRARHIDPHKAGHFLMKLMFCMFAEDIELLPRDLFLKTVKASGNDPAKLSKLLTNLFEAMAKEGGTFGADEIAWFNGGLFADAEVIDLKPGEIQNLIIAAGADWSNVEPSIFGTLFERILDPKKRGQLGAHYTSADDIKTLLGPVLYQPLKREWDEVKAKADQLWEKAKTAKTGKKLRLDFERCVNDFLYRLAHVTVLDPACGSGNFLYVAINMLLDLEKEVLTYMADKDQRQRIPSVRVSQLHGIEINEYARELAQVVIWIGFLQWMKFNGFVGPTHPVLEPMETIECRDAILDLTDPERPKEPDWPDAEFIVGNPPFLGDKKMRAELGDRYVETVRRLYESRLPGQSDLCCYWFEKAREMIKKGTTKRAGLLGTQGIRGGANRVCLDRIKASGDVFFGVSDQDWVLEGATVHVSMVGFDNGHEKDRVLDGMNVLTINPDLTTSTNVTVARPLGENASVSFIGASMHGPFELDEKVAVSFLNEPNVHGKPNSDLIRLWANAKTITQRISDLWIVDVPPEFGVDEAAFYQAPFEYLRTEVLPVREKNRRPMRKKNWWILGDPQKAMRSALQSLRRFIITPRVSKHRLFVWANHPLLPTDAVVAIASEQDHVLGLLHSRVHETWARAKGTQLREEESGFRYGPSTCFETFPFPEPTDAQREAIAAAAKHLDTLRNNWLNPPEWTKTEILEFPGSADGPWKRYVHDIDPKTGIGTVRYPRVVAKHPDYARKLRERTLTNLYNKRLKGEAAWLASAHRALDEAVFAAYGWPPDLSDDDLLAKLLDLNLSRAGSP